MIGHRNITKSVDAMDALLFGPGFDIISKRSFNLHAWRIREYGWPAREPAT